MDREDFLNKKIKMMMQEGGYTKPQAQAISLYDLQQVSIPSADSEKESTSAYRKIKKIQRGVTKNGKDGVYYYYDKTPDEPGFDPEIHRDWVSSKSLMEQTNREVPELYNQYLYNYKKESGNYYQEGTKINLAAQFMSPQQDFSKPLNTPYDPYAWLKSLPNTNYDQNYMDMTTEQEQLMPLSPQDLPNYDRDYMAMTTEQEQLIPPAKDEQNINERFNILNSYGGIGLEDSLAYTGQAFGNKEYGKGAMGAGLSLLKGSRNFLTGYASGKENNRVKNEYMDKRFNTDPNFKAFQQGGLKNSEFLTGQFVADEGQGNVNVENKEFIKRADTGNVQQVVGEPHVKNGKIADGVDVNLNQGDKVLSTYVKIPPKDVKELKQRYDISLRKGATFADAQKAFDKKIGITKLTDELAEYIEKIGKNDSVEDATTKRLNEIALTQKTNKVQEKLTTLKNPQSMVFEDLFSRQEVIPKKGKPGEILDKNGKPIEEKEEEDTAQQGGIAELAKKHGISIERANELVQMQEGGEQGQDQMQQVFEAIAQMLQQGMQPEEVAQQLVQMGVPQEQVEELINQVMQGGMAQQGGEQDQVFQAVQEMLEQGIPPEEVAQQLLQMGVPEEQIGQIIQQVMQPQVAQQGIPKGWSAPKKVGGFDPEMQELVPMFGQYKSYQPSLANIGVNNFAATQSTLPTYNINTRINPTINGYEVTGQPIVDKDMLTGVEWIQPYKEGVGYGAQMVSPEETVKLHDWYFDTKEKKDKFIEASKKQGRQPEIEAYQKAYNEELKRRGKDSGMSEEEINNLIETTGFSDKGVQKLDGLFGAFTSSRPLWKKDLKVPEAEQVQAEVVVEPVTGEKGNLEKTTDVLPWLPQKLSLFPSSLDPIAKEQIYLNRIDPVKTTPESMLQNQESLRQTDVARVQASGLSPLQQEALMASGLATSQISGNDAISKAEQYNAQNQFAVDQFNIGQGSKEDITNAQFRSKYQDQVMGSLANQERDMRNFYTDNYLDQASKFKYIDEMNWLNAKNSNYQNVPGRGITYLNNQAQNFSNAALEEKIAKLTPEQELKFKKKRNAGMSREDALALSMV